VLSSRLIQEGCRAEFSAGDQFKIDDPRKRWRKDGLRHHRHYQKRIDCAPRP
jgi:hypothetical protein